MLHFLAKKEREKGRRKERKEGRKKLKLWLIMESIASRFHHFVFKAVFLEKGMERGSNMRSLRVSLDRHCGACKDTEMSTSRCVAWMHGFLSTGDQKKMEEA